MTAPKASFRAFVGKTRRGEPTSTQEFFAKKYEGLTKKSMAKVVENFRQLVDLLEGSTPDVLYEVLQPIYEKSQYYVPVKTGLLKSTGDLKVTGQRGGRVRGEISYGGNGACFYAPIVHERIDFFHTPPTRAKFLQAAIEEEYDDLRPKVITAYARILGLEAASGEDGLPSMLKRQAGGAVSGDLLEGGIPSFLKRQAE